MEGPPAPEALPCLGFTGRSGLMELSDRLTGSGLGDTGPMGPHEYCGIGWSGWLFGGQSYGCPVSVMTASGIITS